MVAVVSIEEITASKGVIVREESVGEWVTPVCVVVAVTFAWVREVEELVAINIEDVIDEKEVVCELKVLALDAEMAVTSPAVVSKEAERWLPE